MVVTGKWRNHCKTTFSFLTHDCREGSSNEADLTRYFGRAAVDHKSVYFSHEMRIMVEVYNENGRAVLGHGGGYSICKEQATRIARSRLAKYWTYRIRIPVHPL